MNQVLKDAVHFCNCLFVSDQHAFLRGNRHLKLPAPRARWLKTKSAAIYPPVVIIVGFITLIPAFVTVAMREWLLALIRIAPAIFFLQASTILRSVALGR